MKHCGHPIIDFCFVPEVRLEVSSAFTNAKHKRNQSEFNRLIYTSIRINKISFKIFKIMYYTFWTSTMSR